MWRQAEREKMRRRARGEAVAVKATSPDVDIHQTRGHVHRACVRLRR
jgi:hypothetical protein